MKTKLASIRKFFTNIFTTSDKIKFSLMGASIALMVFFSWIIPSIEGVMISLYAFAYSIFLMIVRIISLYE